MVKPKKLMLLALLPTLAAIGGCGNNTHEIPAKPLSDKALLGDLLFADKTLSESGQQSCATCHVQSRAFAADDGATPGGPALAVPFGGVNMNLPGLRNAPSLMYASFTPPFSLDGGGGFFRDGRASSLAVQAQQPFVSSFEMANSDATAVAQKLAAGPNRQAFVNIYGSAILADGDATLAAIGEAIAAYETENAAEFHPFSSKFDAWTDGTAKLTAQEMRGLALYNNAGKGNCAACHPSSRQQFAPRALFTDFSYDNLGVPRNWAIAANGPSPVSPVDNTTPLNYIPVETLPAGTPYIYYDMGLCGPLNAPANDPKPRQDLSGKTSTCGQFKVPTLRNIALTAPYFHNGRFDTLQQVVEFYVSRDITNSNPFTANGTFFVLSNGLTPPDNGTLADTLYNDLPAAYAANVNVSEPPYAQPSKGLPSALNANEITDLVAFLCTLNDGFDPAHPAAYTLTPECAAAQR